LKIYFKIELGTWVYLIVKKYDKKNLRMEKWYFVLSHLTQEMELMGACRIDHNVVNCEQDVVFFFYFNLLESSQSVRATYSLPAMSFTGGEPQSAELYRRAKNEVNKLFGQQNLQQRIHHHTRIKVFYKSNQSLSLSPNKQIV